MTKVLPWSSLTLSLSRCQTKMKQLEQEAHRAAGQIFLVTSNTQLRTVCTFMWILWNEGIVDLYNIYIWPFPLSILCLCVNKYLLYVCTRFYVVCMLQCYGFVDIVDLQCLKVLFEKLCLHERCENKKLPKTINKQQQSTSEAAVGRAEHINTNTHRYVNLIPKSPLIHENQPNLILSFSMCTDTVIHTHMLTQFISGHITAS